MEDRYRDLVLRQLSGLASPEEAHELEQWIAADPAHAEYFHTMQQAWDAAGAVAESHDARPALERVMRRAQGIETPIIPLRPDRTYVPRRRHSRRASRRAVFVRVAATLVAVAAGVGIWRAYGDVLVPDSGPQSYATEAGQRATLTLADGSKILLGPESELSVPGRVRSATRDVRLRGTAYFQVARDPRRPFRVHSAGAVTQVLGTRFVVRAYPGEDHVDVAVEEGRVSVRGELQPDEGVIVEGGELARVEASGVASKIPDAGIDRLLGWTEGRLVFRDVELSGVLRELERWYGMEVRVAEAELAARRVTLSFQDAPIDEVLDALRLSLDVRFDREGRVVTLYR